MNTPVVTIDPGPALCRGNWCWEFPRPQGNSIDSVWVTPTDTWFGGAQGTLLHWNNSAWDLIETGTYQNLNSVWASSPSNIWAVGYAATLIHGNSTSCAPVSSGFDPNLTNYSSIWGTGPNNVYVTTDGFWASRTRTWVYRYDGSAWSGIYNGSHEYITGVGAAGGDIWLTGSDAYHGNPDSGFTHVATAPDQYKSVSVIAPGKAWLASQYSAFESLGDGGLREYPLIDRNEGILDEIYAVGPASIWATGVRIDGGAALFHYNGQSWSTQSAGQNKALTALGASGDSNVWVSGTGGPLLHSDGGTWGSHQDAPVGPISGGAGPSSDFWMGAQANLLHWENNRWVAYPNITTATISDLWFSSTGSHWAVGSNGTVLRRTNGTWTTVATPSATVQLTGVSGTTDSDVWVVGTAGTLWHWNGSAWQTYTQTTADLNGVHAIAANDVWAAGRSRTLLHFTGTSWQPWSYADSGIDLEFANTFRAINGTASNDMWVAASEGKMLRYDGTRWTVQADFDGPDSRTLGDRSATLTDNYSVLPLSPSDVWVGAFSQQNRNIYHWNGSTWTYESGISESAPSSIVMRGTDLIINGGGILRHR